MCVGGRWHGVWEAVQQQRMHASGLDTIKCLGALLDSIADRALLETMTAVAAFQAVLLDQQQQQWRGSSSWWPRLPRSQTPCFHPSAHPTLVPPSDSPPPPSCQVGLLDIDICGPSAPKLTGLEGEEVHQSGSGWSPVYVQDNLAVMSIGT